MNFKILLVVGIVFNLCGAAYADESAAELGGTTVSTEESVAPAASKWKAAASSYYYSFEGTKEAHDNLYSFGATTLAMQMFDVQYQASPNWTVMVLGTHMENYVETRMFGMTFP